MNNTKRTALVLALAATTTGFGELAVAQNQSMLEEVIVTARKREQSLQDVSLAVTAVPSSVLRDSLIGSSADLVNLVPSLNLQGAGTGRSTSFNIRGIGTQSFSSAVEPSVSTLLDGVVLGRSGMAFTQLVDIERIEVLRGPQGTLFGKNASAGAVHFITKDPSEEFEAEAQVFATEDEEYRSSFTVSNSINDEVAVRLTGFFNKDEGWVENVFDGDDLNDSEDWGLRGKIRWAPSDSLEFKWSSDVSDREASSVTAFRSLDPWPNEPPNNQNQVDGLLSQLDPVVPGDENIKVNLNGDENGDFTSDSDAMGHSLEVNWDIGDHTLTSISAYRDWEVEERGDVDNMPTAILGFNQGGGSEQDQLTQELRLASSADQFISYVAGLYYFDQHIDRTFSRSFNVTGNDRTEAIADMSIDSLNYAAFGEATMNISDTLRLIVGARYTYDEVEFEFERTGATLGANPQPYFEGDTDEDDISGKVVLEWNASDEAMVYASYVQGYKGPGFNVGFGSRPDISAAVDPETSDAFEIGLKSNWFENRLMLNVAIFHTEYEDFQAQASQFIPKLDDDGNPVDENGDGQDDGVFSFILANVGEVETQGIEIDFMAQPTENLSLFGGIAYIDAEIISFEDGSCSFGQGFRGVGYEGQESCGDRPAVQDLDGGELPQSPDWKLTLAANYRIPLESMGFDAVLKANFRAQDDVQFDISQDTEMVQEAYEVLDLSVALEDKNDHYTVTAFVKNVMDDFYTTSIASYSDTFTPNGYGHRVPRYHERTAGVEVRYRWY
jgi:iron complex outermembrane receptor protein